MEAITIVETVVRAHAGGNIAVCAAAALELAILEKRKVVLLHNEKRYIFDPNEILGDVIRKGNSQPPDPR